MLTFCLTQYNFAQCTLGNTLVFFSDIFGQTTELGQSFSATCNGKLDKIRVLSNNSNSSITVRIYSGSGNGGTLLGTLNNQSVTDYSGNHTNYSEFDFSSENISLTNGSTYTFMVNSADLIADFSNINFYVGGDMYSFGNPMLGVDLYFQVDIAAADNTDPVFSSAVPTDNSSTVLENTNIAITFSEAIAFGTGNITIVDLDDASSTVVYNVNFASEVSISGSVLTINPTGSLESSTNYAVQIDATAIDDLSGNSYAGIFGNTAYNFTTGSVLLSTPLIQLDKVTYEIVNGEIITNKEVNIEVYSITGKKVLNKNLQGIYIVKFSQGNQSDVIKIVI